MGSRPLLYPDPAGLLGVSGPSSLPLSDPAVFKGGRFECPSCACKLKHAKNARKHTFDATLPAFCHNNTAAWLVFFGAFFSPDQYATVAIFFAQLCTDPGPRLSPCHPWTHERCYAHMAGCSKCVASWVGLCCGAWVPASPERVLTVLFSGYFNYLSLCRVAASEQVLRNQPVSAFTCARPMMLSGTRELVEVPVFSPYPLPAVLRPHSA